MTSLIDRNRLTLAATILLCAGLGWAFTAQDSVSPALSATLGALLTAVIAIGIGSWNTRQLQRTVRAGTGARHVTPECP
jgi:phosphotransferase system  glucose/maltose/N-acetylglucosamine-specific IIC component